MEKYDHIIVNLTQTKHEVTKYGIRNKRITIIPMGIDERFLVEHKSRSSTKKFKIGYIGGLSYKKNIEFALKASLYLNTKYFEFDLYGAGNLYWNTLYKKYQKII